MTIILIAVLCFTTLALARVLQPDTRRTLIGSHPYRSFDRLTAAFHEICSSLLDPNAPAFLEDNAPTHAVTSFRIQQYRLAQLSLRAASDTIWQRFADTSTLRAELPIQRALRSSFSKAKAGILLFICAAGRSGLALVESLSYGIPRKIQMLFTARVLSSVGAMSSYFFPDAIPDKSIDEATNYLSTADDRGRTPKITTTRPAGTSHENASSVLSEVRGALSKALPNDVSRMIYLSTLRDNNTGGYLHHPDLGRRFGAEVTEHAMLACHEEIYERVIMLGLEDLTDQLDVYFGSIPGPKVRPIENWKKLQAYRATIPVQASPISAEILFMKIEVALAVLEARLPIPAQ
jgi:hypothetical protein